MTLCMGGSISAIHGFNKALGTESEGRPVAVIAFHLYALWNDRIS